MATIADGDGILLASTTLSQRLLLMLSPRLQVAALEPAKNKSHTDPFQLSHFVYLAYHWLQLIGGTMSNSETVKQERMHIRLDALSKQKLEKAASYSHKKLSEFVLAQSLAAAENIISEHELITLMHADWDKFLDALENQPAKNAKLTQALALHDSLVVKA